MIHTIGPYLLPRPVPVQIGRTPQMPLLLQENFTVRLVELLRQGEIDCAIMALPLPEAGLVMQPLYDEPFVVAVPQDHELAQRESIDAQDLKQQTMLLLGSGHCFRDRCWRCVRNCRASRPPATASSAPSRALRWRRSATWWPRASA